MNTTSAQTVAFDQVIDYRHPLLLAEHFSSHVNRSTSTLSTHIVGHARLFERFAQGKGCSAYTYRDTMIWFAANWPEDLDWPDSIPRHVVASNGGAR